MYQNIYVNTNKVTKQSKVYLWDDTAGLIVSDYKPYAYKKNPLGKYTSMFGDKLDKVTSGFSYGSDGYFETDVPIATRVLIDCYGDSDEISKNHRVLYLDIETETAGGFPKIDIAQQPITAIALYDYTIKKYICMVLDISGEVSGYEEDDKVVITFKTEEELLMEFLRRYKILNPTIISGWNCLYENSDIWTKNKIIKLKNVVVGDALVDSNVIKKSNRNIKKSYKVSLADGRSVTSSIDHIFPIYKKQKHQYKNFDSKNDISIDTSVGDMIKSDDDLYLIIDRHENTNKDISIRDILLNSFDRYCSEFGLQIFNSISDVEITEKHKCLEFIREMTEIKVKFAKFTNRIFSIDLDNILSSDILYVLGILYTDGSFDKKRKVISFYNNNTDVMNLVADTLDKYKKRFNKSERCFSKNIKKKAGGGTYTPNHRYRLYTSNEFSVLFGFIYSGFDKRLNVELLSMLSKTQFDSFFSGCIDGDGNTNGDQINFCNYNNDIRNFQELLIWNGVHATSSDNTLHISKYENYKPKLKIEYKKLSDFIYEQHNTTLSDKIKIRNIGNNKICVKIDSISESVDVPMYDIETDTHYFYCNGIKTHNCNGFDIPYMFNRIKKVLGDFYAYKLSPIGIVRKDDKTGKMTIAGVSSLDYLVLYKKFTVGIKRLPNYRLDTVAYEELKLRKLKYEGSLGDLLRKDIKKFVEYNINDVFLVVGIDRVNRFIELAMALAHVGHVAYEDFEVSSKLLEGALLTYLRKNNLVAPNKPKEENSILSTYVKEYEEGEEPDDDDAEDDEKGFEGAYVKEPIPGRYDWIFSCDINSLYPSTIMSLNISPETLVGQISNWNTDAYAKGNIQNVHVDIFNKQESIDMVIDEFNNYISENNLSVASNGALYNQNVDGLLKTILVKWYAERVEFKKLGKKASDEKNKEVEQFYNLRQMVQKILLNSLYGVLGLKSWRFANVINAEAVTISGQNIIKTTGIFCNNIYNKKVNTIGIDYVTYSDTDSAYLSATPLMVYDGVDPKDHVAAKAHTIKTCAMFASSINSFYNVMMPRFFNTKTHRIKIAEDVIASCAIWLAKKKYVMHKVYDMEKQKDLDYKLDAKGIDIVRTSFPIKFKELMENIIVSMLTYKPKKSIDNTILDFKGNMSKLQIVEIAKNAPATYRSKKNPLFIYDTKDREPFTFIKGTIANGKATLAYNDMLKSIGLGDIIEPIYEGAKMKWVYLKDNPYGLDQIGFKADGTDPKEVLEFIANYIDKDQIFDKELFKKLENLYSALNWEIFNENLAAAEEFFTFED